jgi:hypothetical protein
MRPNGYFAMIFILSLNNLVVLRTDGTNDCVLDTARQHALNDEVQDTKFRRKKLSCPGSATFNKAFEIESLLKESVDVGLHDGMIEGVISEAASNPHSTYPRSV